MRPRTGPVDKFSSADTCNDLRLRKSIIKYRARTRGCRARLIRLLTRGFENTSLPFATLTKYGHLDTLLPAYQMLLCYSSVVYFKVINNSALTIAKDPAGLNENSELTQIYKSVERYVSPSRPSSLSPHEHPFVPPSDSHHYARSLNIFPLPPRNKPSTQRFSYCSLVRRTGARNIQATPSSRAHHASLDSALLPTQTSTTTSLQRRFSGVFTRIRVCVSSQRLQHSRQHQRHCDDLRVDLHWSVCKGGAIVGRGSGRGRRLGRRRVRG